MAPGCSLDIVVAAGSSAADTADEPLPIRGPTGLATRLSTGPDGSSVLDDAGLNPRYTFETFVKGASNQFALAAALRVAETPARSYNPLFIYGDAGLGKTHLLHAIGHYVHHNYQHHEVRYVSTETFLNEFVDAIRTNTGNAFKRRYRDIDVLLIDDIQFLENREGLQEEFFHTFNSLHGANKQIVISSDRHARRHPHAGGTPARPVQVGPDHRHPAARPRDPAGHPAQQGRARARSRSPPRCSSSSPPRSRPTSASSRAR